jgi:hypothetical protein
VLVLILRRLGSQLLPQRRAVAREAAGAEHDLGVTGSGRARARQSVV